jgi:hypothetical protein
MDGVGPLSAAAGRRLAAAAARAQVPEDVDMVALAARLDRIMDRSG